MRNALCRCKKRLLINVNAKLKAVKPYVKQNLEVCPQGSLGHYLRAKFSLKKFILPLF